MAAADGSEFNFSDDKERQQYSDREVNHLIGHHEREEEDEDIFRKQKEDIDLNEKVLAERNAHSMKDLEYQMRFGGNYFNINDPSNYSKFWMVISGQIQSGTFDGKDGLCCSYQILAGQDWEIDKVSYI